MLAKSWFLGSGCIALYTLQNKNHDRDAYHKLLEKNVTCKAFVFL